MKVEIYDHIVCAQFANKFTKKSRDIFSFGTWNTNAG